MERTQPDLAADRAAVAAQGEAGSDAAGVRLEALRCVFDGVAAVERLDLQIDPGEFFALIGPSGCGKTTTLRMLAGLERPTSGRVRVDGRDVTHLPAYKRPVNTVFQQYALFPHLTIAENVAFGLRERRESRETIRERVGQMLELVGLTARRNARPSELSGGQQQRVALARALVMEPQVLLFDEPLGALDLKLRKRMQALVKSIQHQLGITFVYVTHDQEEAFSMADRVGIMNQGLLEQVGAPEDVYRRPSTRFVADFVGASNGVEVAVADVGDGRCAVEIPGLRERLAAQGAPGLTAGAGWLVLRSEAMRIDEPGAAAPHGDLVLPGTLEDVAFLGPQIHYRVRTDVAGELLVTAPSDAPERAALPLGAAVQVRCPAAACWVVPPAPRDEGAAAEPPA